MRYAITAFTIAASLLQAQLAFALPIGIPDTFESLTTEGWFAGGGPFGQVPPVPPTVIANGGPTGAGDAYLQVTSLGGQGAGSRLVAMNLSQWAGDYTTIAGIQMDVRNLGTSDLTLRLYLENPIPGPPTDDAVSQGIFLAAGGGWQTVFFPLDAASLTLLNGDLSALLQAVTVLRLMHNPLAGFPPPSIAALLGVDNIMAIGVPAPALSTLLLVAAVGWLSHRQRRFSA